MKTLRWLGIAVALLLVIVLAIPFLINVNQFRPRLEAALTQALGREVKLGDPEGFLYCRAASRPPTSTHRRRCRLQ